MKTIVVAFLLIITLAINGVSAESLQPAAWQAYGIAFQAPAGYTVEDDSEEGYIISTPTYFITVQLLDGEGIQRSKALPSISNFRNSTECSYAEIVKATNVCTVTCSPKKTRAASMFLLYTPTLPTHFLKPY